MMNFLYQNIFKRKSFHLFRNNKSKEYYKDKHHITDDELDNIKEFFNNRKEKEKYIMNLKNRI